MNKQDHKTANFHIGKPRKKKKPSYTTYNETRIALIQAHISLEVYRLVHQDVEIYTG